MFYLTVRLSVEDEGAAEFLEDNMEAILIEESTEIRVLDVRREDA